MARPRQYGLRALFRVTLYCAIALLVGVLVTLPTFLILLAVTFLDWLLERR
jgi:hypothetical protein